MLNLSKFPAKINLRLNHRKRIYHLSPKRLKDKFSRKNPHRPSNRLTTRRLPRPNPRQPSRNRQSNKSRNSKTLPSSSRLPKCRPPPSKRSRYGNLMINPQSPLISCLKSKSQLKLQTPPSLNCPPQWQESPLSKRGNPWPLSLNQPNVTLKWTSPTIRPHCQTPSKHKTSTDTSPHATTKR